MFEMIERDKTGINDWNCEELSNLTGLDDRKNCFHVETRQNFKTGATHYGRCHDMNDSEDADEVGVQSPITLGCSATERDIVSGMINVLMGEHNTFQHAGGSACIENYSSICPIPF